MLPLLLGCASSTSIGITGAGGPPDVEQVGGDTATGIDTGTEPEEPEFFDDTVLHTVAITLTDDATRALRRDPYTFVDGTITVDGAFFPHVGVRLRGKIGSFRTLTGKPKFKIDFNAFSDDRLGVHETLALNNEVVDCSFLREPAGYAVFRALGLPAPRTVYTSVTVNDEDYGLYVAVEFPDDTFLADRYADGTGNLYDGKYAYYDNGSYALIDFTASQVGDFQLEEGADVGNADVRAIADAVTGAGTFEERLGPLLDLDSFHRHLAAEQWVGHLDGYALNTNNYRVYFDPSDGLADLLVYDLDYGFYPAAAWGMNWASPAGVVAGACWADAACAEAQRTAVAAAIQTIDTDTLLAAMDAWTALIADAAVDDPRRECGALSVGPDQAAVRAWIASAPETMAAYWGVQ